MHKIVTDPLYIRCKKVLSSCKTQAQYNIAVNYCNLAKHKTMPKFGDISDDLTHLCLWRDLIDEFDLITGVEWN